MTSLSIKALSWHSTYEALPPDTTNLKKVRSCPELHGQASKETRKGSDTFQVTTKEKKKRCATRNQEDAAPKGALRRVSAPSLMMAVKVKGVLRPEAMRRKSLLQHNVSKLVLATKNQFPGASARKPVQAQELRRASTAPVLNTLGSDTEPLSGKAKEGNLNDFDEVNLVMVRCQRSGSDGHLIPHHRLLRERRISALKSRPQVNESWDSRKKTSRPPRIERLNVSIPSEQPEDSKIQKKNALVKTQKARLSRSERIEMSNHGFAVPKPKPKPRTRSKLVLSDEGGDNRPVALRELPRHCAKTAPAMVMRPPTRTRRSIKSEETQLSYQKGLMLSWTSDDDIKTSGSQSIDQLCQLYRNLHAEESRARPTLVLPNPDRDSLVVALGVPPLCRAKPDPTLS